MPEAYRTVDASVYQSVLDLDEDDALDDDFEEDDAFALEAPTARSAATASTTVTHNQHHHHHHHHHHPRSTVKSILWAGLTSSFGSVAQCGLVGGVAQYVWSQVRKVDAAQDMIRQRTTNTGFATMAIGIGNATAYRPNLCRRVGMVFLSLARGFVRQYSDLGMCHVAAYYKSYHRAARDVATLVEESGT
jgi:hypothetical protein